MDLTAQEKNRYSRHILLNEVGLEGQKKLKAAKILVIGAGGLGCPVLQYLTAAGVGTIGIIDFDKVDETNLQRQIIFDVNDIGLNKALAARQKLEQQNPFVTFEVYQDKLTNKNALSLIEKYDIIIDGTDNFSTKYLVSDACVICNKPLVSGAIYKFEGQVAVFNYKNGPSYRCLFPEPPNEGSVPNCSEIGVIGILPGLIGTQQANEAIKIVLEIGEPLSGKLLTYDALKSSFLTLTVNRSKEQFTKVLEKQADFQNHDYELFCGVKNQEEENEISVEELRGLLEQEDIQIIDVRESYEEPKILALKAINIPLNSISLNIDKIDKTKQTVVFCQHGIRSLHAIKQLQQHGFDNLINLKGGIVNW